MALGPQCNSRSAWLLGNSDADPLGYPPHIAVICLVAFTWQFSSPQHTTSGAASNVCGGVAGIAFAIFKRVGDIPARPYKRRCL
jgi:hypothetical protein